jgi:hypothetical protein
VDVVRGDGCVTKRGSFTAFVVRISLNALEREDHSNRKKFERLLCEGSIQILTCAVGAKAATPEMRAKDKASFMVWCWGESE